MSAQETRENVKYAPAMLDQGAEIMSSQAFHGVYENTYNLFGTRTINHISEGYAGKVYDFVISMPEMNGCVLAISTATNNALLVRKADNRCVLLTSPFAISGKFVRELLNVHSGDKFNGDSETYKETVGQILNAYALCAANSTKVVELTPNSVFSFAKKCNCDLQENILIRYVDRYQKYVDGLPAELDFSKATELAKSTIEKYNKLFANVNNAENDINSLRAMFSHKEDERE